MAICQAKDIETIKVDLESVVHFNCEFPKNISSYPSVIFRLLKMEKTVNIATYCRIITVFKQLDCELTGSDETYSWGIHYEGDNLTAIEVIKKIVSPNDAGKYECNLEMWSPSKRSEEECEGPCHDKFASSPVILNIAPPIFPVPIVNFEIFNEATLNCDNNPIFGCVSNANNGEGAKMYVSRGGLPVSHGEIIPLWKGEEEFIWKCCLKANCTNIRIFSTNISSPNKYLTPLTNVKIGDIEIKSLDVKSKLDHETCGVSTPHSRNKLKSRQSCVPNSLLVIFAAFLFVILNLELAVYREGLRYWARLEEGRNL